MTVGHGLCFNLVFPRNTRDSAGVPVFHEFLKHDLAHARIPCVCQCFACFPPKGGGGAPLTRPLPPPLGDRRRLHTAPLPLPVEARP